MPFKGGRMTAMERAFIEPMARTGDAPYAAAKAGFAQPEVQGYKLAARPAVRAEVARRVQDLLFNELLPLAYEAHKSLLKDTTPAGARGQAVKLAYDRTLGLQNGEAEAKEPSEMTYDELQASIARLRAEQSAREEGAIDVTPANPSVFD
jgi:phage terminase small subunit